MAVDTLSDYDLDFFFLSKLPEADSWKKINTLCTVSCFYQSTILHYRASQWFYSNYRPTFQCLFNTAVFFCTPTGAIIRDGDRKSWDVSRPMIWDNFSIFRTNCAILTSCIHAASRTCRGFSRVCCHVAWSKIVRVASFHSEGREIRKERRTRVLLCTFMLWVNGKGEFLRVENFVNFAIWMNNICSRLYA